jgi:hypothetical protein
MAFKPNYRQLRNERNRTKEQRKQEKLLKREENAARRKAERGEPSPSEEPHGG